MKSFPGLRNNNAPGIFLSTNPARKKYITPYAMNNLRVRKWQLQIIPRIGEVEALVDEGEVRHDIVPEDIREYLPIEE